MKLLKMSTVEDRFELSRATINRYVKSKLIPAPVKLGYTSRWLEDEIDQIIEARVRGATNDEIRQLVARLEEARHSPMQEAG